MKKIGEEDNIKVVSRNSSSSDDHDSNNYNDNDNTGGGNVSGNDVDDVLEVTLEDVLSTGTGSDFNK